MANPVNLTKVSGMLIITQTTGAGSYYGATDISSAQFNPNGAGDTIYLQIGKDFYQIKLTDLRVNGQAPTTMSTALVLLNSILGT